MPGTAWRSRSRAVTGRAAVLAAVSAATWAWSSTTAPVLYVRACRATSVAPSTTRTVVASASSVTGRCTSVWGIEYPIAVELTYGCLPVRTGRTSVVSKGCAGSESSTRCSAAKTAATV